MPLVTDVTGESVFMTRRFLSARPESALSLLSNLETYGPRIGDGMNSGNFQCVIEDEQVRCVFCLTRRGNLLLEAAGRVDLAPTIAQAVLANPVAVEGVLGEWDCALAVWQLLLASGRLTESYRSRERLYRRDLSNHQAVLNEPGMRLLGADDFHTWDRLSRAYLRDLDLPVQGTPVQRLRSFEEQVTNRRIWGCAEGSELIAMASLTALYQELGQLGVIYTIPERRSQGLAGRLLGHVLAVRVARLYACGSICTPVRRE